MNNNHPNLEILKNDLKNKTEEELTKELFKSSLLNIKAWDQFSSLLLLILGAVLALIIPNLSAIKDIMCLSSIRWVLFLLLMSSISGLAAKYYFAAAHAVSGVTVTLENEFPKILSKFNAKKKELELMAPEEKVNININVKAVIQPIIDQYPKFCHKFLWKLFEKGKDDILLNYKRITKYALLASLFITLQIFFFILVIIFIMINLKNF
jgi:hypothetical protein